MRSIIISLLTLSAGLTAMALDIDDINVRDPFIFANGADSTYYLYRSKSPAWGHRSREGWGAGVDEPRPENVVRTGAGS